MRQPLHQAAKMITSPRGPFLIGTGGGLAGLWGKGATSAIETLSVKYGLSCLILQIIAQ
jgi:hypothetical protein